MYYNEIDVLIGSEIMNWTKERLPNNDEGLPYTAEFWTKDGEKQIPANFFNPSTNIKDAWKIVEKLSYGSSDINFSMENHYMGYWAQFTLEDSEKPFESNAQATAPLAICAAALKIRGIELEENIELK